MKKNYFMLALASMMMAACANNDLVDEGVVKETPQAIGFETFANKATRAVVKAENSDAITTTDLSTHHDYFEVWGYKNTTDTYVFGTSTTVGVKVNSADGTYSPLKFWDKAATKYEFYAAAPYNKGWKLNVGSTQAEDYFTLTDFVLNGFCLDVVGGTDPSPANTFKGTDDVDLMIASAAPVTSFTDDVSLTFNHILSRLNITVKKGSTLADNSIKLEIKEVSVHNLVSNGSFDESVTTGHRWSDATTPANYDISGKAVSEVVNSNTYYVLQALVIPQDVDFAALKRDGSDADDSTSKPYIYIKYEIGGENYEAYYNLADAFGATSGSISFKEGYQNTLNITIDADLITFTATAFDWDNKSSSI